MEPSTSFNWERMVTPARWIATVLAAAAVVWDAIVVIGSASAYSSPIDPLWYVRLGLVIVGVAVAVFLKGIGEVVGGLALIGVGVWTAVSSGTGLRPIISIIVYALAGLLFIACGWYTLAHRHPQVHGMS